MRWVSLEQCNIYMYMCVTEGTRCGLKQVKITVALIYVIAVPILALKTSREGAVVSSAGRLFQRRILER